MVLRHFICVALTLSQFGTSRIGPFFGHQLIFSAPADFTCSTSRFSNYPPNLKPPSVATGLCMYLGNLFFYQRSKIDRQQSTASQAVKN